MTDAPRPAIAEAVRQRLARRHRAEGRFRAFGVGAIALAIIFLGVLLGTITLQASGAFTNYVITLPVTLERTIADPRGDMSEASLRRGSYNQLIQRAVQSEFPAASSRSDLRELFGLYSGLNAASVMRRVIADPSLVDTTINVTMPANHEVDLYLKGITVDEHISAGSGTIEADSVSGSVALSSDTPAFANAIARIRQQAVSEREVLLTRAARLEAEAANAASRDAREAGLAAARRARDEAARFDAVIDPESRIVLGPRTASLLIRVNGGVVAVSALTPDGREAEGRVLLPLESAEASGSWSEWVIETPAAGRRITDQQAVYARTLEERGMVERRFNTNLFLNADSREPELAGVMGAFIGSVLTMLVTMLLAVPIGVGTAIYLEEFAPKNRLTGFIEVNINNLAAVPSIVFGLLGLAVFINTFGMPRSAPLVGGFVLALMTLPTVIISSRAALRAVPPSIREAALGVGASRTQAVFQHVLPLAMPGILTGSIIGLAQALGETAPLLMIGMVAFVADAPSLGLSGLTQPSTVMPVQVFLWSGASERAFEMRTAAAILVLLTLMIIFNAVAIILRRRFERRW
ncbi:phosphate ABC transporter permease PstA [Glycocaulis abyssi]|uniref:Phosphate transport system permease protein PstA n=1 Tax=Glycocaulis abyssi TaxID=1433403 RepID=A0ABV9ND82_9PROT